MGVTGKAFQTGQVIYTNKISNLAGFIPSIDNLTTNVKDVHSCMIVPIFGHSYPFDEIVEDRPADDEAEKPPRKPIAIL